MKKRFFGIMVTLLLLASIVIFNACPGEPEIPPPDKYAITVTQPAEGGTFTVAVGSSTAVSASTEAEAGQTITLSATPAQGFDFSGFTVNPAQTLTGTGNTQTFTMPDEAVSVTAVFIDNTAPKFAITVTQPAQGGTFTVAVGSGTAGSDSTEAAEGQTITLSATPAQGFDFSGFTLSPAQTLNGTGNTQTFTMPAAAVAVTAVFIDNTAPKFAITVTQPAEGGTFTVAVGGGEPGSENTEAAEGETITLTAIPESGFHFDHFSLNPEQTLTGEDNVRTFTMPGAAVAVTAVFIDESAPKFAITLTQPAEGGTFTVTVGSGTAGSDNTEAAEGETITLTATPAAGFDFASFTVTPTQTLEGDNNTFTFLMPDEAVAVTAVFAPAKYAITVNQPAEGGTFTVAVGSGFGGSFNTEAEAGQTITLTATPSTGFEFTGFTVTPAQTLEGTGNTQTFVMPGGAVAITAEFSLQYYTITKGTSSPAGSGDFIISASTAVMNTAITLTPTANSGYRFVEFTSEPAGIDFSGSGPTRTFLMPTNDVTINALFQELPSYGITKATVIDNGDITITPASAKEGETVTLTPSANSTYVFGYFIFTPGTLSAVKGSGADWTFTMPGQAVTVGALFVSETADLTVGREEFSMASHSRGADGGNYAVSKSAFSDLPGPQLHPTIPSATSATQSWQTGGQASVESWVGIDLGAVYNLGWVRINWGVQADMMVNADIQVRDDMPTWWVPNTASAAAGPMSDDGWTKVGEIRQVPKTAPGMTNTNPMQMITKLDANASGRYIRLKRVAPHTSADGSASPTNPQLWSTWSRVQRMSVFMPQGITENAITKGTVTGNGDFTISPTTAYEGQIIYLEPMPETGFRLDHFSSSPSVIFTEATGENEGKWRFYMPASAITVNAEFVSDADPIKLPTSRDLTLFHTNPRFFHVQSNWQGLDIARDANGQGVEASVFLTQQADVVGIQVALYRTTVDRAGTNPVSSAYLAEQANVDNGTLQALGYFYVVCGFGGADGLANNLGYIVPSLDSQDIDALPNRAIATASLPGTTSERAIGNLTFRDLRGTSTTAVAFKNIIKGIDAGWTSGVSPNYRFAVRYVATNSGVFETGDWSLLSYNAMTELAW